MGLYATTNCMSMLTLFLHEALLCSHAHLSQTKSPFPSSITRVSSGSISLPHISHFIDWVFVISFLLASLCYKHHFCCCRSPLVLRLVFSIAANSAASSSFQKISSSLELEISLLFLLLLAARSAASDSVLYYPPFCSLVFIVNAYDYF